MAAPWLFWSVVWLASCIAAFAILLVRREPTIWRGSSLLRFTASLGLIAVVATIVQGGARTGSLVVVMAALVLGTWRLRRQMLVSGHDVEEVGRLFEDCARRVNLTSERLPDGYRFALPGGGEVRVAIRAIGPRLMLVAIRAVPPHRKAELFGRLFGKQYRSVLPTIVLRG